MVINVWIDGTSSPTRYYARQWSPLCHWTDIKNTMIEFSFLSRKVWKSTKLCYCLTSLHPEEAPQYECFLDSQAHHTIWWKIIIQFRLWDRGTEASTRKSDRVTYNPLVKEYLFSIFEVSYRYKIFKTVFAVFFIAMISQTSQSMLANNQTIN